MLVRPYARHAHVSDAYRTPPTNYVQLLQHIATAKRLNQLDALIKDYGDKFDAVHVSAALAVVPRLLGDAVERGSGLEPGRREQPEQILTRLQEMATAQTERMQVRQISNMIWSLGKCHKLTGGRDEAGPGRALARRLLAELARGNHRKLHQGGRLTDAAQLLHGLARLRLRAPAAQAAVAKLARGAVAAGRPVAASNLALIMWGFGRLGYKDPGTLRLLADRVAEEKLYLRPWSAAAALRTLQVQHVRHDALAAAAAEVRARARGGALG
ncbi:hypothetical protein MNEG_9964 [Monoraphidium neglectum]|uniref:Uncharacterized protein n=1 Tax=Monoraphidium neglectum TaxID=145388 RepID=A0A0D2MAQ0_9CHLO|nr:hypothetical protein MNEG_9964 [Monoraphidium neglectum]KIY97996.1 hypothetical protein MNEG_9964 [Monoraphidium neglectum]|eukprot:XP_013897016.1 hypothetical protein MNEG_9964 [Monoraphidium neglectum]